MKKEYIPAQIEIYMFEKKQVIHASSEETTTTTAEHDNAFLDLGGVV